MSKKSHRCSWANSDCILQEYHDNEWGIPVHDDRKLFEILVLEMFQTGLSWKIIIKKRSAFRRAFDDYDINKISEYDEEKVNQLLSDGAIVRNRKKINATIVNAQIFSDIQKECGSFSNYLWGYVSDVNMTDSGTVLNGIELTNKITKDLKKRGMRHIGTTVIYAYLAAVGLINNHEEYCYKYNEKRNNFDD